jgi:FkbM family methyltransferase
MILFIKLVFKDLYHLFKTRQSRTFLWLVFWYSAKKRYHPTVIKFLKYRFKVPDALSFVFQFKEIFAEEYYKFQSAKANPLIYDCGANIGTSILYFKKLFPQAQIKAFEADAEIAKILADNLSQNHISGVEIIPKAVWKDSQGIEISIEGADGASVFGEGKKVFIPSLKLKDLLAQETVVDMLKMDIEGAENEVIIDCAEELKKVKNLFIEYHAYQNQIQKLGEILQVLERNGFRYFIKNDLNRPSPLVNRIFKNKNPMDLQLNIFAYLVEEN